MVVRLELNLVFLFRGSDRLLAFEAVKWQKGSVKHRKDDKKVGYFSDSDVGFH